MLTKTDITRLQSIDIEQVAEALGMRVSRHKALCPFHDDTRPSLTFNRRTNKYRCYVCDARGCTIQLVMDSQDWHFYESCLWLAKKFDVMLEMDSPHGQQKALRPQPHPTRGPAYASSAVDVRHLERLLAEPHICDEARMFLYDERRISPQVVRQTGLTSISSPVPMSGNPVDSWFNAPSLLIPYRDIDGHLLSVQARYLGTDPDKPRFQFPKGSRCTIFNLPVFQSLSPGEDLWITEGVTDCLAMMSSGRKAIAIPSATLLTAHDRQLLSTCCPPPTTDASATSRPHVHMAPDNDRPGERLFQELRQVLPDLRHHQLPAQYKDFGEYWTKRNEK